MKRNTKTFEYTQARDELCFSFSKNLLSAPGKM